MEPKKNSVIFSSNVRWFLLLGAFLSLTSVFYTCKSFGRKADGERLERIEHSSQWKNGQFVNPQPLVNDLVKALWGAWNTSPYVNPEHPIPVVNGNSENFQKLPDSGLRVTWFGHSSTFLEIDGVSILTDPIWAERTSPFDWIGPKRWYAPPIALKDLPKIDLVLISHDHYDHLDLETISKMKDWDTVFVVPLGVGANLVYWGIPESKIKEMDWWQSFRHKDVEIISTPARHASGRYLLDNDEKLWSGYALVGPKHRVYFSGDTGLFPAMKDIGNKYGPFDLTMIETGQYHEAWPDWHIGPEQALIAHQMVKGKIMLPIHWGLFALAYHSWTEPIERVLVKAKELNVSVITPKPGESAEPDLRQKYYRWWPELPWKTGAENPIVSGQLD